MTRRTSKNWYNVTSTRNPARKEVLVCQVGSTTLKYQYRAVDGLHD